MVWRQVRVGYRSFRPVPVDVGVSTELTTEPAVVSRFSCIKGGMLVCNPPKDVPPLSGLPRTRFSYVQTEV